MSLLNLIKDTIFPIHCLDCNIEGQWLCDDCKKKIELNYNTQTAVGNLKSLTAFFVYDEKTIIGELIKLFKYNYVKELEDEIEKILNISKIVISSGAVAESRNLSIIPVPLHVRRKRERGFNQAEILANIFNRKFKLGVVKNNLLQRKKYTSQQAKLKKEDRIKNLQNAFVINPKESIPKNILLVDDVYTTGATMQECASVLYQAGSQSVQGMVLARG